MARRQNGRPLWLPTKEEFILSTAVISTSCSCLLPAAAPGSCCHCGWGSACSNVRTGARVPRAAPAATAVHCLRRNSPLNPAPRRYRCAGTRRQSCQQLHADTGRLLEPSGWAASLRRAEGRGRGRRSLPRARMGVLPNADRREGESILRHHPRPAPPLPAARPGPTERRFPVRASRGRPCGEMRGGAGGAAPLSWLHLARRFVRPPRRDRVPPAPSPPARPGAPRGRGPALTCRRRTKAPRVPSERGGSALPGAAEPGEGTAGGRGGRRAGERGRARRRRGPGRAPPQPPPREGPSPAGSPPPPPVPPRCLTLRDLGADGEGRRPCSAAAAARSCGRAVPCPAAHRLSGAGDRGPSREERASA